MRQQNCRIKKLLNYYDLIQDTTKLREYIVIFPIFIDTTIYCLYNYIIILN